MKGHYETCRPRNKTREGVRDRSWSILSPGHDPRRLSVGVLQPPRARVRTYLRFGCSMSTEVSQCPKSVVRVSVRYDVCVRADISIKSQEDE